MANTRQPWNRMSSLTLSGKVAIVSGAAQGIGAAVAQALAQHGIQVAALDIQPLTSEQENIVPMQVDITQPEQIEQAVQQTETKLGPIDYLVNVAGILHLGQLTECSNDDWFNTFAVNTHGPFLLSRHVAQYMQKRRSGSIVTVASNAAQTPRIGMGAYAASKAATRQMTRCLGLELAASGIRCNIVSPGSTDTAMQRQLWADNAEQGKQAVLQGSLEQFRLGIPLQKIAQPTDIADVVLFLLSDQAHHITLQDVVVDGGATLGI